MFRSLFAVGIRRWLRRWGCAVMLIAFLGLSGCCEKCNLRGDNFADNGLSDQCRSYRTPDKKNELIYDRTRFVLHTNGLRWTGNPAGHSASNAELQTPGNWALAWTTPNRVGAVCFRTNG